MKLIDKCTELHKRYDKLSGCTFIIAINICHGDKGNGGTRMLNYKSVEHGIEDAIALSKAMTKKCLVIGNNYNGGYSGAKGVIIGNPNTQKSPDMFRRFGKFVNTLNGKFQTGSDMNITLEDIAYMAERSEFIDGLANGLGDTAIPTALGIITAMKTALKWKYNNDNLKGKTISVQGVGNVGRDLVKRLVNKKANVIVTDINTDKLLKIKKDFGVKIVKPNDIYKIDCDIFSPNATGRILNKNNIQKLNCSMVIGSANNQLNNGLESVIKMKNRGITYFPDYLINIGGVFLSMCEVQGKDIDYVNNHLKKIITTRLNDLFNLVNKNKTLFQISEEIYNI